MNREAEAFKFLEEHLSVVGRTNPFYAACGKFYTVIKLDVDFTKLRETVYYGDTALLAIEAAMAQVNAKTKRISE